MRHKAPISLLSLLVLFLLLVSAGSVAYFVVTKITTNTITTSGVSISLNELSTPSDATPFDSQDKIATDVTYSKIPYVENTGPEPVWLRSSLSLLKEPVASAPVSVPDLTTYLDLGGWSSAWADGGDGFYYYTSPVAPGATSEPLFRTIRFRDESSDLEENTNFAFTLTVEATQTRDNGTSALTASWSSSEIAETTALTLSPSILSVNTSDLSNADLFPGLKNLLPGDSRTQIIRITNTESDADYIKLYLTPDSSPSDLLSRLTLNLYSADNTLLTSAPASTDAFLLATLAPGETTSLTLELSAPLSLDPAYAFTTLNLPWIFTLEKYKDDKLLPPNTGAPTFSSTFTFFALLLSFLLSLRLFLYLRRVQSN